jgi:hypothetical protein
VSPIKDDISKGCSRQDSARTSSRVRRNSGGGAGYMVYVSNKGSKDFPTLLKAKTAEVLGSYRNKGLQRNPPHSRGERSKLGQSR